MMGKECLWIQEFQRPKNQYYMTAAGKRTLNSTTYCHGCKYCYMQFSPMQILGENANVLVTKGAKLKTPSFQFVKIWFHLHLLKIKMNAWKAASYSVRALICKLHPLLNLVSRFYLLHLSFNRAENRYFNVTDK